MKTLAPSWHWQIAPPPAEAPSTEHRGHERTTISTSRERLKRELSALLQEVSRLQPLVLFFDDLQWADPSTVDLLAFLADRFAVLRTLIVGTYRPSELRVRKHPLLGLQQELQARLPSSIAHARIPRS